MARVLDDGVPWLANTDMIAVCLLRDALEYAQDLATDQRAKPSDVAAAFHECTNLLSTLAFTPTARARLGLAEIKSQSALVEILNRKRGQGEAGIVATEMR